MSTFVDCEHMRSQPWLGGVLSSGTGLYDDLELTPPVDMVDQADAVCLFFEVPGVDEASVVLSVEDQVLTFRAQRTLGDGMQQLTKWLMREVAHGSYARTVTLPRGVMPDRMQTECRGGMFMIKLPKVQSVT